MKCVSGRPGKNLQPLDYDTLRKDLQKKWGNGKGSVSQQDVLSASMYPKEFDEYKAFRAEFGPVDCLPTHVFLCGPRLAQDFTVDIEKGKVFLFLSFYFYMPTCISSRTISSQFTYTLGGC